MELFFILLWVYAGVIIFSLKKDYLHTDEALPLKRLGLLAGVVLLWPCLPMVNLIFTERDLARFVTPKTLVVAEPIDKIEKPEPGNGNDEIKPAA